MSYIYRHNLDPIAFTIGDQEVAWYWLVYLFGYFWCWGGLHFLRRRNYLPLSPDVIDRFVIAGWFGVILGGRIGYVLFYNLEFYLGQPAEIFALWNGGMSFHGAFIGILVCLIWICRKENQWKVGLNLADALALLTPPLLALGRIANFINGELVGRPSSWPIAVIFPHHDALPRHPSQLYEALGEGIFLTIWLWVQARKNLRRPGITAIYFTLGYASIRFLIEFVREPDPQINYWLGFFTQGQMFCALMLALGIWALRKVRFSRL